MRSLTPELSSHISGDVTTLAVCWRVTRSDGALILGTEHDEDLTIDAGQFEGTYLAKAGITGSDVRSTSDMSVDNVEVTGAIDQGSLTILDLSAADIEAGLFDNAQIALFIVNWQAPNDGQIRIRAGHIGEISRTSAGQYRTELRGLVQKLSQITVRSYGADCDATLGDSRCGVDLTDYTIDATVTETFGNRIFQAELDVGSPTANCEITLFLPMPNDIQVGDTFTIRPGCDKYHITCYETFNNIVNFRGHGYLIPGLYKMSAFGGQTAIRATKKPAAKRFAMLETVIGKALARRAASLPGVPGGDGEVFYNGGLVQWITGNNAGYSMEVKSTVDI
jgi:hypothetical protein